MCSCEKLLELLLGDDFVSISTRLVAIEDALEVTNERLDAMGTGLTNLQAADADLQAEVIQILTDVQTALTNDDPDAAVQAAADIVNKAVADLQAGDPAPPVTPPAPPA